MACVDIEATLQVDLLALLPDQVGGTECSRRLLFGDMKLMGSISLSDIGLEEGSMLTLVHAPMFAAVDCLLRRHREGVVDCLGRVPAHFQRSRAMCRVRSLLSMRLKRFPFQQWCGDGMSACLGTVHLRWQRNFSGHRPARRRKSKDDASEGFGGLCVLAALEVAHLFSCHLASSKTVVLRHPKWIIKHLVVVGVGPAVIP